MKLKLVFLFMLSSMLTQAQTYKQSILHYFGSSSTDGMYPRSGLLMDAAGSLYGTTSAGGGSPNCFSGCGTVFKLDRNGNETILHSFTGGGDGADPLGSLVMDNAGSLYGTTFEGGGSNNYGTVFKITASGKYSVLHRFTGSDGVNPNGSLRLDLAGNLYGTTALGGDLNCQVESTAGCGVVFELSPRGVETVLYRFHGGSDGSIPVANLLLDHQGHIYGTAAAGGNAASAGVFFELTVNGVETVLYTFCQESGCADGVDPTDVVRAANGNFYGVALYGGNGGSSGQGVIFAVSGRGAGSTLYSFCPEGLSSHCPDGDNPIGPLLAAGGNLYGTTYAGGYGDGSFSSGPGVVYKLTPAGVETVLYRFPTSYVRGGNPQGGVIVDAAGNLYGTTVGGGRNGGGVVFKLSKNR